jgi:hypothetical protein
MILRRYGTTMQSVELNFDSRALNEIGFRRDRVHSIPVEEFEATYQRMGVHELDAEAEGWVQDETEKELLNHLESEIGALLEGLAEGELLVVVSEAGVDYPKTRHKSKVVVEGGENRLFFSAWVEPPLKMGRYRKA